MISLTTTTASILDGYSRTQTFRAESWLGPQLLAANIPFATGFEDANRRMPERVVFTLPRFVDGFDWSPGDDLAHPLAANGQQLRVDIGVGSQGSILEFFQRGWFVVAETRTDGDLITVEARGKLALIEEAKLASPFQPTGLITAAIRRLLAPTMPAIFDSSVTDRAVPSGINYDNDRLGAVYDILDALGAESAVTEDGTFYVTSVENKVYTPVMELSDASGRTVIKAGGTSTRDGAYNAYVARGTAASGAPVQAVVYDTSGPKGVQTYFNPMPVPYLYESPLIQTVEQARSAALAIMTRKKRLTNTAYEIEMLPHPGLQIGDAVLVNAGAVVNKLCTIESIRLPYNPGGGIMQLIVRTVV